ncbi:hypothetical protein OB919_03205 [Halobacteria archaeon AArc-curdl1]|uniref:Uncharacterized protein n=1 Tax=Natronosalvus hydrolyticus TaxID=2979988 RepID=A0AAP2Z5I4_9EURY|nr:hypothetical protein [Halobacteria archaeon AArc-curdl1]
MNQRPPSPETPATAPNIAVSTGDSESILVTTPQLVGMLENDFGCDVDESTLETLLLELDRGGYVEWVTITRSNDYVWDLSGSAEKIGDAIAEAVVDRLNAWLQGDAD